MTNQEFSDEFDVLYNNITSNQAPGLDEYEKSVFLTKAQDEVLKAYFDPMLNKTQEGFDGSQRRQIDFSMVTKTSSLTPALGANFAPQDNACKVTMPTDILTIINERVKVLRVISVAAGATGPMSRQAFLTVIPIQFSEFDRLMSKPYKRPVKWQAWRVISASNSSFEADLVPAPGDTIQEYVIRYIKRPDPIILFDLDGLSICGKSEVSTCKLDPILHYEILQRAVEMAKAAYSGDLNSQLALGQQSQTEVGHN